MTKVTDTLEAAIKVLRVAIKHGATHGGALTAYQLVQQAYSELEKQEKEYDLVRKVQKL